MVTKNYYIGSAGPFEYDDADVCPGDGGLVRALRTSGGITVTGDIGVGEINVNTFATMSFRLIGNPAVGDLLRCNNVDGSGDWATLSFEPAIAPGSTAQYWRGDKTWQTLNQAAVAGLTTASSPTFAGLTISGGINTGFLQGVGLGLPHVVNKVAAANIRNSHNAAVSSNSADYVKVKTITLTYGLLGQQRFLFDLATDEVGATAYGQIYRNGVALGSGQTETSLVYVTKTENITQVWNPGDTCELWIHGSGGTDSAFVQNFRIAYDDAPTVAVASVNS